MATVKYNGITYTCVKALKGDDYVRLLDSNDCMVASFDGVSDFTGFELSDCDWTTPNDCDKCYVAVIHEDGTVGTGNYTPYDLAIGRRVNESSVVINDLSGNQVLNGALHSTASGKGTTVAAGCAHTEGLNTKALSVTSHAEGARCIAGTTGKYSDSCHAEGQDTMALADASHAQGRRSITKGPYSHAGGFGSTIPSDDVLNGTTDDIIAAWDGVGYLDPDFNMALGSYSFVHGLNNLAAANSAVALGGYNMAAGAYAIALGCGNKALAQHSVCLGSINKTYGYASVAGGDSSKAGTRCFNVDDVDGVNTIILESTIGSSFQVGDTCIISIECVDDNGAARTITTESTITALDGRKITVADALFDGISSVTSGYVAHSVFGERGDSDTGMGAVALGNSKAVGRHSTALNRSYAYGVESLAVGDLAKAYGYASIAGGRSNVTKEAYQVVLGGRARVQSGDMFVIGAGEGNTDYAGRNLIRVNTDGNTYINGQYNTTGADYAEYYEWADSNVDGEDRRGCFVTLEGNKIRKATSNDDYILGIVSANPAVVGNAYDDIWHKKYMTDIFGCVLTELVHIPAETETITKVVDVIEHRTVDEDGIADVTYEEVTEEVEVIVSPARSVYEPVLNPDYDPDAEYVSRKHRKEWSAVGTHGQLIVIDDGSCQVNGYCKVTDDGTATASELRTLFRVADRLDATHIRVILK